jgi:hypothetical protein
MFLYNIAFSLEFIVIGLGVFLIGWSQYKCAKHKMICETTATRPGGVVGTDTSKVCSKRPCGTGFLQAVGVILIILAVLNFIDTLYNSIKYHNRVNDFKQKIEMIRKNQFNSNNPNNQNDQNKSETNSNASPTPATTE